MVKKYTDEQEVKIDNEFELYACELLTDDELWTYIRMWMDGEYVWDIIKNLDTETKEQAIKDIKKIIKKRGKRK